MKESQKQLITVLISFVLLPITWSVVVASLLFRLAVRVVERTPFLAPARPSADEFRATLERKYADSEYPLLSGDRRAFAEMTWPPETYPSLYMEVPADLQRPAAADGRLYEGIGVSHLAEREIGAEDVAEAAHAGKVAQRAFVLAFVTVYVLAGSVIPSTASLLGRVAGTPGAMLEKQVETLETEIKGLRGPTTDPSRVSWPGTQSIEMDAPEGTGFLAGTWAGMKATASDLLHVVVAYVVPWLTFTLVVLLMAWTIGRVVPVRYLETLLARKGARYATPTKDSFVRYEHRADIRRRNLDAYAKQLKLATGYQALDPLIKLGRATGSLRHRGDQAAPIAGQALCMDYSSLFQHTIVFGGTGENKTAGVLKPMFRQLLDTKSPAGNPLGFFVIDAKAVLWKDLLPKIERAGRMDDVRVVGFGPDQWGVDLLAGLNPVQAAAVLRTIMDQQGGGGGKDPFWANSAVDVFRHMLVIAEAYRWTPGGQEEWLKTGVNPYSIAWVFRAVCSDSVWNDAVEHVLRAMEPVQFQTVGRFIHSATLWASMDWLNNFWFNLAENTKSGVVGQVSQILDTLSSNEEIRDRFACGELHPYAGDEVRRTRRVLRIGDALGGKIVMVAVSSLEHGIAAKAILMFLKSGLFRAARLRETQVGRKACQAKPCVFVADEYQEIVSSDSAGLSDGTFWNVARSTGVAGIVATQTMASLSMALGNENATANLIAQFRSKLILRVEDCSASRGLDMTTLQAAQALSGLYERCRSFQPGQYESLDAQQAVTGWHPLLSPAALRAVGPEERQDLTVQSLRQALAPVLAFTGKFGPDPLSPRIAAVEQKHSLYDVDERYYGDDARDAMKDDQSWFTHKMQLDFRREDQHRQTISTGIDTEPGITPSDILSMGRWFAYAHVQRAGARVHDIIELEPDYDDGPADAKAAA